MALMMYHKHLTLMTAIVISIIILSIHIFYYPKWQKTGSEATLSWDVSGYYMYLPATFIYKDLKECKFYPALREKYSFTPDFQQAFLHEKSGNYVMKYSMGQAVQFAPFFSIAHWYATISPDYVADGFSIPYQFMISFSSIIVAFIGLFFVYKSLKIYFDESTVCFALICLVLGTNYLNYAAIDGAMTHNNLFTIYAILIFLTIEFYKNPTFVRAISIGGIVGLAALTRPTEIISFLIPVLWGLNIFDKDEVLLRKKIFLEHRRKILSGVLICLLIGSLQFIYWYYITGEWIVYSYQEEGFSWLQPHFFSCLLSYRSGWLMYSPLMVFSLVGFWYLYKSKKNIFYSSFIFCLLFIYIAFSWDTWWYGGSLGQRTMVQCYPILLFPLSAWIEELGTYKRPYILLFASILSAFIYLNLWFTHQAHRGGLLHAGMMTKAYYWKTLGTYTHNSENLKLLDTNEYFKGQRADIIFIDSIYSSPLMLNDTSQYTPTYNYELLTDREWVRLSGDVSIMSREWDVWRMAQMTVTLRNKEDLVKQKFIRLQRDLYDNQTKRIFMDVKIPASGITDIDVFFWNANSQKPVTINNVTLELFNKK